MSNNNPKEVNIEKFDFATLEHEKIPYVTLSSNVIQKISDHFAGFIWVFLQSLPPDWKVNKAHMLKHFNIGEDKYDKHIRFLKDSNLLEFIRERDDKGAFKRGIIRVLNGSKFVQMPIGGKTPGVDSSTGGVFQGVDYPGGGKYPPLTNTISTKKETYLNNIGDAQKIDDIKTKDQEKSDLKRFAIENTKCKKAFEQFWFDINCTIEEAYDACQQYWEAKDGVANWSVFERYLKNANSSESFAKSMNQEVLSERKSIPSPEEQERISIQRAKDDFAEYEKRRQMTSNNIDNSL